MDVTVEVRSEEPGAHEVTPTSTELFSAGHWRLDVRPPAPFVPCNPSIFYDGNRWLCSVRAVDYRLGVPNEGSSSLNYILTLNDELAIVDQRDLVDSTFAPKNPRARTRGFEDLRLFQRRGDLCALATACDVVNGGGVPEMCMLEIHAEDHRWIVRRGTVLRGPWSRHAQKNWIPTDRGHKILYRAYPTLAMYVEDWVAGEWDSHVYHWLTVTSGELDPGYDFLTSTVRGSSQAIWFDRGWLAVVHEHKTKRPLSYVHRFMWWDKDFKLAKVSRDFVWKTPGVEFCAGLAFDGVRLVASYGVHDMEAWLTVMSPDRVRDALQPLK